MMLNNIHLDGTYIVSKIHTKLKSIHLEGMYMVSRVHHSVGDYSSGRHVCSQ